MKLKTLIADHEPLARERLRFLLLSDPEVEIVRECPKASQGALLTHEQAQEMLSRLENVAQKSKPRQRLKNEQRRMAEAAGNHPQVNLLQQKILAALAAIQRWLRRRNNNKTS